MAVNLVIHNGSYTCYNHWGNPSLIDYMLCDTDVFDEIDYFEVHDLLPFSIHCMISCTLQTGWCNYDNVFSNDDLQLHEIPIQYIWSSKDAELWKRAINHEDIKSEFNLFSSHTSETETSVDNCLDNLYNLLNSVGKKAGLNKKNNSRKCYKSSNKKMV